MSWEDAVRWYRAQPGTVVAVLHNYFDLPVAVAAERYRASEEFGKVIEHLGLGAGRKALDVGSGNGIASYALARSGWRVVSLEPDPSDEVGAGAIRRLAAVGLPIEVLTAWGERIPLEDKSVSAVFARQVLHHARDLDQMVSELARVLTPGGRMLTVRDHVAESDAELAEFLNSHPLHRHYGGENAFPLGRYHTAFRAAGLRLIDSWGPYSSILNYYPGTEAERQQKLVDVSRVRFKGAGRWLAWSRGFRELTARKLDRLCDAPGRLYSFLLEKPVS